MPNITTRPIGRDTALDALRGLMLVIMAIDHIESPLTKYTWETLGFVSAASGFVFLSGYLAGLVYSKYADRNPAAFAQRAYARAWTIYKFHMMLLLGVWFFTVFGASDPDSWRSFAPLFETDPVSAFIYGAGLLYQPPLMDILPMYTVFLLLTPVIIRCYRAGWTAIVFVVSAGLWLLAQTGLRDFLYASLGLSAEIEKGYFDIFAWQILFVGGSWLGYARFHAKPIFNPDNRWLVGAVFSVLVVLYMMRHGLFMIYSVDIKELTDRTILAPLRLANFVCLVYLVGWLLTRRDQIATLRRGLRYFWKWLAFLGEHSLQVFAFHAILCYMLIPVRWSIWHLDASLHPLALVSLTLAVLLSLTIPAWLHRRYVRRRAASRQQRQPVQMTVSAADSVSR